MSIMSDDDSVRLFQRAFGLTEDGWPGRCVRLCMMIGAGLVILIIVAVLLTAS